VNEPIDQSNNRKVSRKFLAFIQLLQILCLFYLSEGVSIVQRLRITVSQAQVHLCAVLI
jgi:hypothetical protein